MATAENDRFDYLMDRRQWFLKEWQSLVTPLDVERRIWDQQSVDIARTASTLLGILNGAALVALPAFVALGGVKDPGVLVLPTIAFVVGLVAVLAATVSGFIACATRAEFSSICREEMRDSIVQTFKASVSVAPGEVRGPMNADDEKHKYLTRFKMFRSASLVFSFIAICAFVAGTAYGVGFFNY